MRRSKEKVTVKWSKKEEDWLNKYSDSNVANTRNAGKAFFTMIGKYEEFMRFDWEGKPTGFTTLRDHLSKLGFDPDTFEIKVHAKNKLE